jgi:hypothetical protein
MALVRCILGKLNETKTQVFFNKDRFSFLDRKIDGHLKMLTVNFSQLLRDLE